MTNEEMFEDLKQFIEATVSQSEKRIRADMATKEDLGKVNQRFDEVDLKLDTIANAVGEVAEPLEQGHRDHEHRIQRLERRAA